MYGLSGVNILAGIMRGVDLLRFITLHLGYLERS